MTTLVLVAALCIALLIVAWRLEVEVERRKEAERDAERYRKTTRILQDDIRRLMAIEEAAYGMYSALCVSGTLSDDDPQVKAFERVQAHYWKGEVEA
jgi:hypothetical protein